MSKKWKERYEEGWTDIDEMNQDADEAYEEDKKREEQYARLRNDGKVATASTVTTKEVAFVDPGYDSARDNFNRTN